MRNYEDYNIDLRKIDRKSLKNKKTQEHLTDVFEEFILDADSNLQEMKPLYEKAALYYEGHQAPAGVSTDAIAEFMNRNGIGTNQLKKDDKNVIWYPDNIIKPAIDAIVGDYTDVKKTINVTAGGIERTRNVAAKYQTIIEYHNEHIAGIDEDDEENMWTDYRIPAIEGMILFGEMWTDIDFNPRRKIAIGGAIEMETIEPIEMLIDLSSRKKYFKDMKIIARRKGVEINEARKYLKERFDIDPKKVVPDSDGFMHKSLLERDRDKHWRGGNEYVTFYKFQTRRLYTDKVKLSDEMELEVPQEYKSAEPEIEKESNTYFKALFNKNLGVIDHGVNKYAQYTFTPYVDQQSRIRLRPIMRSEYFWVLQDVNNIGKTLMMDNARQQNIVRLFIAQELEAEYGTATMERFLRAGGIFSVKNVEDLNKMMKTIEGPGLKPEVYELFRTASADLRSISQRTNPLDGEFPKDRLASRTLNTLINQSRKSLSGIDTNIAYAAVKESQLICKIVKNEMTDEQILVLTGDKQKRIPLNGKMDLFKYQKLLDENKMTIEDFEEKNDVRYVLPPLPKPGEMPVIPPDELMKRTVVIINPIYHGDKVSINLKFEFEEERKRLDRVSALQYLFDNPAIGKAVLPYMLDALGFSAEKEEILEKIDEQNQFRMIEKMIADRGPEAEKIIMEALKNYDTAKLQNQIPGQTVPAPAA